MNHLDNTTARSARGLRVCITGANSGLGFATANALALAGAEVILACRDNTRARLAASAIEQNLRGSMSTDDSLNPVAALRVVELDLASLTSIERCATAIAAFGPLDVLLNNAGIMAGPLAHTNEGFERQFGVNHLGHFALTARLLPLLGTAPAPRIITVASLAHFWGELDLANLNAERRYRPHAQYAMSKLANLLFTQALAQRLAGSSQWSHVRALACHPGACGSNLGRELGWPLDQLAPMIRRLLPSIESGARASIHTACASEVNNGDYWGPRQLGGLLGRPGLANRSAASCDPAAATALWQRSIQLTEVNPPL